MHVIFVYAGTKSPSASVKTLIAHTREIINYVATYIFFIFLSLSYSRPPSPASYNIPLEHMHSSFSANYVNSSHDRENNMRPQDHGLLIFTCAHSTRGDFYMLSTALYSLQHKVYDLMNAFFSFVCFLIFFSFFLSFLLCRKFIV